MTGMDEQTLLIKRAQSGHREAFEALLSSHYDVMYRMAFKWCGNREDAEDITQNACIKLAKSIVTFQFRSSFRTWLYRVVINAAKDWAKARPKDRPQRTEDRITGIDRMGYPAGEDKVYAMEVLAHIRTMPKRERVALFLVFGEGLTHHEAAKVMDCKESTVSWYIHEARKNLQSFKTQERRYG